jgi:hypothetical protein
VLKKTKMNQSTSEGLSEVDQANMTIDSSAKTGDELERYRIDEIALIESFEEEEEDPEIENIEFAELTQLY